jgi:subtilisin family serine protease
LLLLLLLQITHPDLKDAIWTNPGEVAGDGIDNDGNGYVDDTHWFDFVDNDGTVFHDGSDQYGTHVAGIIGEVVPSVELHPCVKNVCLARST